LKPLSLILAFLPLIVFSLLSRLLPHGYIGVAALVAALTAVAVMLTSRPLLPPKILNAVSLVLFGLFAILGFTLGKDDDRWLATWGGAGIGVVIGAIILLLVPIMPFTEQFAREAVPESYWSSPTFKKVNRVLSIGWGVAIFAIGVSRILGARFGDQRFLEVILGVVIPVAIIVYMLKFSKSYPERAAGRQ
jgi:hypothetical protein